MENDLNKASTNLLNALPKCMGEWLSGSGGHAKFSHDCNKFAKWVDESWSFCYEHLPLVNGKIHPSCKNMVEVNYLEEAHNLSIYLKDRNCPVNTFDFSRYELDNLLWLLTLVKDGHIPGTNSGDWVCQILYKLSENGLTSTNTPNHSLEYFINNLKK